VASKFGVSPCRPSTFFIKASPNDDGLKLDISSETSPAAYKDKETYSNGLRLQ